MACGFKIGLCVLMLGAAATASAGDPTLKDYRGTTWELKQGQELVVQVVFGKDEGVEMTFSRDGAVVSKSTGQEVLLVESAQGRMIWGGESTQSCPLFPRIGLMIYDKNCLLLPDNDAPGDCLRKK
jgi:hypothetical protein